MLDRMSEQTIALVTGANKGIGYAIAAGLDVLINNAGVAGGWPEAPTTLKPEEVQRVVETNVIGVIRVTNALLPPSSTPKS